MVCIYCGGKTSIINSRLQKKANQKWRRRQCEDCKAVFTSVESVDLTTSLVYRPDSGRTEPFQRDKLFISIYEACRHRKDATKAATALTATVLGKLLAKVDQATITRQQIISKTTEVLKHFDKAAVVQYTAYHPL